MRAGDPFRGLASRYGSCRPDYPPAIFAALRTRYDERAPGPVPPRVVLDVGSGTGIATRLLRATFGTSATIIGLEASADMLLEAKRFTPACTVTWVQAMAERLPSVDARVDLVLAAQAVQWFDRPAFYAECVRVLRRGGLLAVVQNNRNWRESRFLSEYERLLETFSPGYTRFYRSFDVLAEWDDAPGLTGGTRIDLEWVRTLSSAEFTGMSLSSTKMLAAIDRFGSDWMHRELDRLLMKHLNDRGEIDVPYHTELFICYRDDLDDG